MKKLLFGIVLMATSVLASTSFESLLKSDERRPPPEGSGKNPFGEDEDLVEPIDFNVRVVVSTYGRLARMTELGAIGQVIERGRDHTHERDYYRVHVTTPLWGCTNNQIVTVMEKDLKVYDFNEIRVLLGGTIGGEVLYREGSFEVYPTNQSHVVFCVTKNEYDDNASSWWQHWDDFGSNMPHKVTLPYYQPYHTTRSWWYVDYEDGVPTTYFTNLVRVTHTQRNWTNYYEVVRDGKTSTSNRVKGDANWDFHEIIHTAKLEQLLFMKNDPLFPESSRSSLEAYIQRRQGQKQP